MSGPRCQGRGEILVDLGIDGWDDQPCPDCAGSGDAPADQIAELRARVDRLEAALGTKPPSERIGELQAELLSRRPFGSARHALVDALVAFMDERWTAARGDDR